MRIPVNAVVFEDFETLDIMGPVEFFGLLKDDYQIQFYSLHGGLISNMHGVKIQTLPFKEMKANAQSILVIPGGVATFELIKNQEFLDQLKILANKSGHVLTICTGSSLLAATGVLDGIKATSNKMAFEMVKNLNDKVLWQEHARWVIDGKFYTSSGVSAGMDMTLAFIHDTKGEKAAQHSAEEAEYVWNNDPTIDPFSKKLIGD
ncbi:DJ-1/PfpI family protein [Acinetobacter vivianii]|uniref:DJ-1/PfpI family protein n=1 Tax=Acinetobacter vivianii TaxID=1776742 RepID=UPI002DB5E987|nr:DJ-1/PfpI family protein [Acinetobacter vivianii]MEB6480509.1 DJ-1/PfpI family protein [Acinetobacter vivianii]MEB6656458.1 DJ-1/PfpI family protein [Acinetobacter vivianii]